MVLMFGGEEMEVGVQEEEEKNAGGEGEEALQQEMLGQEFEEVYSRWKGLAAKTQWTHYMSEEKKTKMAEEDRRNIDVLEDLVDADMLAMFNSIVQAEKHRPKKLFGLLPLLASCHLGALNAESFCERVISCANNVVTKLHTRLSPELIEKIVVLRMNRHFMDYIRQRFGRELVSELGAGADKPGRGMKMDQ
mmetsp:Transcript_42101/g.98103  ORF Transcript_42101/g.98103 Transcript_42101/m.98103 type:complete len:192 (+) Transcript_42101:233-808(+)